jgi:hypothetical protein
LAVLFSSVAFATSVTPFYEAPGVQGIGPIGIGILCGSSTTCDVGSENFNTLTTQTLLGAVATFGSGITGTYAGDGLILPADQYGGARATGNYLAVADGQSESLTLSTPVNFFGLWFSALDATNTLQFYQTGNPDPIYTFGADQFQALVGPCPSGAYCGNPNAAFLNANSGQQYAYLEFLATGGTFNTVVISEASDTGNFEADNEAVGSVSDPHVAGTAINATPEPGSLTLAIAGASLILLGMGFRRFGLIPSLNQRTQGASFSQRSGWSNQNRDSLNLHPQFRSAQNGLNAGRNR